MRSNDRQMPPAETERPEPDADAVEGGDQGAGLYAQVRGRRRRGLSTFWGEGFAVSVVLHIIALIILAGIKFSGPPPEVAPIRIDTDFVEAFKPEPVTVRSVINMDRTTSIADQGAKLAGKLAVKDRPVPIMDVDRLDIGGLGFDLLARKDKPVASMPYRTGDLTGKVHHEGGRDYESAMDALARPIVSEVKRRRLLVCILFDGSRSLLKERDLLSAQLQQTFDELKFAVTERQEKRIKWAVVSFGKETRLELKPTRDIRKVQKSLASMPMDESGEENVLKGINFCLNHSELRRKAARMFILLLSDEEGDDIGLGGKTTQEKIALKRAVQACKRKKTRVFVLSRDALFLAPGYHYYQTIDGESCYGYQDLGLSTCRQELALPAWWLPLGDYYTPRRPAGFGCYALSMLAHQTGGTFFIISDKASVYKANDLRPYEPEWCYPDQYDKRNKSSALRKTLRRITSEFYQGLSWGAYHGSWSEVKPKWSNYGRMLRSKDNWCDKNIRKLSSLEGKSGREKHARKRWEANYDLTLAQLYKMRVMLAEHGKAVKWMLANPPPVPGPKPKSEHKVDLRYALYLASRGDKTIRLARGREQQNAREKAIKALEKVIRKHPGTPWAATAQHELDTIVPVEPKVHWYIHAPTKRIGL